MIGKAVEMIYMSSGKKYMGIVLEKEEISKTVRYFIDLYEVDNETGEALPQGFQFVQLSDIKGFWENKEKRPVDAVIIGSENKKILTVPENHYKEIVSEIIINKSFPQQKWKCVISYPENAGDWHKQYFDKSIEFTTEEKIFDNAISFFQSTQWGRIPGIRIYFLKDMATFWVFVSEYSFEQMVRRHPELKPVLDQYIEHKKPKL